MFIFIVFTVNFKLYLVLFLLLLSSFSSHLRIIHFLFSFHGLLFGLGEFFLDHFPNLFMFFLLGVDGDNVTFSVFFFQEIGTSVAVHSSID